jgi:vancomycin aglycone glucosyltransferase
VVDYLQRESLRSRSSSRSHLPAAPAKDRFPAGELVAAQFDTVAAVAEECDALVATGVTPTGVWR